MGPAEQSTDSDVSWSMRYTVAVVQLDRADTGGLCLVHRRNGLDEQLSCVICVVNGLADSACGVACPPASNWVGGLGLELVVTLISRFSELADDSWPFNTHPSRANQSASCSGPV